MARTIKAGISVDGLKELRRDLRAVNRTADRDVVRGLKNAAQRTVIPRAAARAKGRIRTSYRVGVSGSRVSIRSRLIEARMEEFGLRHPLFGDRNHWYANPRVPAVQDAVRGNEGEILDSMADEVDQALRRHGFRR